MAYHIVMKTTVDIADDLIAIVKKKTEREGITMRSALHQALHMWLREQPSPAVGKKISRDVGLMSGTGLTPEAASASWADLRALSYDSQP